MPGYDKLICQDCGWVGERIECLREDREYLCPDCMSNELEFENDEYDEY